MEKKEILERQMCGDSRVFNAIMEMKRTDTSFTDGGFMGMFPPKYTQNEVRKIWFDAISLGMQEGLRMGSIQGQRINISDGCKNERHKEFYTKFLKLAEEYNCAIVYHPLEGMCVMDLNNH